MASNLVSIINGIADMPVEIDGDVVPVWVTSDIMDSAEYPQLPVRIIHPIGMTAQRTDRQTLGGNPILRAQWSIRDMILIRPVGMGLGMRDVADFYVEYMGNYLELVRGLIHASWRLVSVDISPQVVEYTAGSGRNYHAVICTLTIHELVQ